MLHTDEEQRKMGTGEMPLSGRVRGDGLIVLALESVRMSEGNPGRSETRVEQDGFAQESSRFIPSSTRKVPQADSIPGDGVVGPSFDEIVREEEEARSKIREVIHASEMKGKSRSMTFVAFKYPAAGERRSQA